MQCPSCWRLNWIYFIATVLYSVSIKRAQEIHFQMLLYCMTNSSFTKRASWAKKTTKWVIPVDREVPRKQASAEGNDVPHTAGKQKVPAPYPEPLTTRVGHCQRCVPKHLAHRPFKCLYSNTLFRWILHRLISGQLFLCSNIMFCFFLSSQYSYLHTTFHFLVVIFFYYSVPPNPCHVYTLTYI